MFLCLLLVLCLHLSLKLGRDLLEFLLVRFYHRSGFLKGGFRFLKLGLSGLEGGFRGLFGLSSGAAEIGLKFGDLCG